MWRHKNPERSKAVNLTAVPVWKAPKYIKNGFINGHFLTVPMTQTLFHEEVGMSRSTFQWRSKAGNDPLFTQDAASGGCLPFAFVVRPSQSGGRNIFGLAHLATNPAGEAEEMGAFVKAKTDKAENVFLVLISYMFESYSNEQRFKDFENGFGQTIPDNNKGIVIGSTGTAAVLSGCVGEYVTKEQIGEKQVMQHNKS